MGSSDLTCPGTEKLPIHFPVLTHGLDQDSPNINSVDKNIKFSPEKAKENSLTVLDCSVITEEEGCLHVKVYRKLTHTDQNPLYDSDHPLQHKLGVVRTLQL